MLFCLFVDISVTFSVTGVKAQGNLEHHIKAAQQRPAIKALQTKGVHISKIQLGSAVSPINH